MGGSNRAALPILKRALLAAALSNGHMKNNGLAQQFGVRPTALGAAFMGF